MSKYLLLRDRNQCPACRTPNAPKILPSVCRCCEMRLFKATDAILRWEEDTGWREYWVWTGEAKGWMHRTQVFNEMALEREYRAEKRPDNYGTKEFLQEKVQKQYEEAKNALKKKKVKIPKALK